MKARGFVAAALAGMLIVAGAAPARAADGPVVTSTGLTEGQLVGNATPIPAVYSDDVVRVDLLVDGVLNRTFTRIIVPLRVIFPAALHDQDATITVRVFDSAEASAEASTRVKVDVRNPGMTIDPPTHSIVHGRTTITVTPTTDDVAEVIVSEFTGGEVARLSAAPWVFTYDFTGRSDGTLSFRANDRAGNRALASLIYLVDDHGPGISPGFGTHIRPGEAWISARFSDRTRVERVEWWVDGALRSTEHGFRYDVGTRIRTVPIEVRAWDTWGQATVKNLSVQLDETGPAVSGVIPAHRALVRGRSVTTTLSASDPAGVTSVYVEGRSAGQSSPGTWVGIVNTGRDGLLPMNWQVIDSAGNFTLYSRHVIVDNTLPKITKVTAPGNGAKVSGTVKTTTYATDVNGIARVELRVNDKTVNRDTVAPFYMTLNPARYGKTFTVNWVAFDKAGNKVSTSRRTWKR